MIMKEHIIIFETDRLIVRRFEPEDRDALYKNHLEDEVEKWIPNEKYEDPDEALDAIDFFADCVDRESLPYVLAIESKQTGELIGDTGINEVEGTKNEIEIGYTICKKYSGQGLATEAVKAMTDFAFSKFDAEIIYGRVMHGNEASVRVIEKNGYEFVKEEFGAEDDPYGNGMLIYKKAVVSVAGNLIPKKRSTE